MRNYFILSVFVIIILLFAGCARQESKNPKKELGALKGVSLSPKSFQSADFSDFFEKAKQTGQIIS